MLDSTRGAGFFRASLSLLIGLILFTSSFAQSEVTELREGAPVERTVARGQTQSFTINLEQNQFLQFVVEQRGIDVVVRVFSPSAQPLGVYDTPNGPNGPEGVSVIARVAGAYRIDVTPLEQGRNPASGRYEIKVIDLRAATKAELEISEDPQVRKAKGLALLKETAESLSQIRRSENRVTLQIQAARLLWESDQPLADSLFRQAIEGVRGYLNGIDTEDPEYYQSYQAAQNLRASVVNGMGEYEPELALEFLRSTRILTDPNIAAPGYTPPNNELALETSLATQVANKNPQRALELARESLKKGYSYNLVETLNRLQRSDRDSAIKLAGEITDKLKNENILKNQEATNLTVNLLQMASQMQRVRPGMPSPAGEARNTLLSEDQYKDLLSKTLAQAVAYKPTAPNAYSVERNNAQMILNSLRHLSADAEKLAPGMSASLEKRTNELNGAPAEQQNRNWQRMQQAINNNSLEEAMTVANQAAPEMKEQLFQQIAWRASNNGDVAQARQIITEHISNLVQRAQALKGIEVQSIFFNAGRGRIDEAMRGISNLRSPKERASMLIQVIGQSGKSLKRSALLAFLEQARGMIGGGRAEDQEHMNALIMLARLYYRLEPQRGFEVVEPLVDQFNEISAAAMTLNNFGQQFYQDGELSMQNGNSVGVIATQLVSVCGAFALTDFERAKNTADRLQRPEVRLAAYLSIAQNAIGPVGNPDSLDFNYGR